MTHATADFIDWVAQLDARGIKWYCGHVFPVEHVTGGLSRDDIANLPRCDRWHDTREQRENCDHGVVAVDDPPDPAPDDHDPAVTSHRPNRHAGPCWYCGRTVLANTGRLLDVDGMFFPVHLDGECE